MHELCGDPGFHVAVTSIAIYAFFVLSFQLQFRLYIVYRTIPDCYRKESQFLYPHQLVSIRIRTEFMEFNCFR